jgi:drug/metabolite transporter (DMT)-like permease
MNCSLRHPRRQRNRAFGILVCYTSSVTPAIEYALGAMLCFGLGDLIYKRAGGAGAQPHHLLMVQSWLFTLLVVVFGLATRSLTWTAGTAWGALAGFFMMTGFYNFAHSLKTGSISINAPIFRLSFVITATLAIAVLGEAASPTKIAGITLALAASWLLLGAPAETSRVHKRETRSSLIRVLIATAAVGTGNAIYKIGLQAGATPASLVVAQGCVVVLLSTGLMARIDRRIRPATAALVYAPASAVVLAGGFIFMVESLTVGDASVVVPIAQMGFGVTALVGFLVLKERLTARKAAGLLAALAALASFTYAT